MMDLNKIYCMDCLEGMKQLPDQSVDLVLTDPPYNTGMDSAVTSEENHPTVRFNNRKSPTWLGSFFDDNMPEEEYETLVNKVCSELFRLLKPNKMGYHMDTWLRQNFESIRYKDVRRR